MKEPSPAEQPLISVIVPTRNSTLTLGLCLSSIKNQTYANIELIVVDNNSTDGTKEVAQKYTSFVFNKGPERNAQRSYAISQASGEYYTLIDSDMELSPGVIEAALHKCEQEGCDAVVLPEISVGEGFLAGCRKLEKLCYLNDSDMELANRFIRASVFHAVGGYDDNKDWIGGEDFDLSERFVENGYRVGRINDLIRHHEVVPFRTMVRKYYTYGKYIPRHIRKHPRKGARQFFLFIRPAYVRNWRLFLKDPVHGLGLLFVKFVQYVAGGIGFLFSLFDRKEKEAAEN